MSGKQSILRTIVNRNVERQLVKEFLMENTKTAGFGGLTINRTPNGTAVEIRAEKPGRVIGKRGKIINDLQKRLSDEFELFNPRLSVEEVENPTLNAQVMAQKIASALERGWYYRRAGASAAVNIMDAGARGVIVTVAGKLTGARNRTQKFILGHVNIVVKLHYNLWTKVMQWRSRNSEQSVLQFKLCARALPYRTRLASSQKKS